MSGTATETLAAMSDADFAALEAAIQAERREREFIERYRHYPPPLDKIRMAARYAAEHLEPVYIHGGTGFGVQLHISRCFKETGYTAAIYPDGRIIFCAFVPTKKDRTALAPILAACKAEAFRRARACLAETVEEYCWLHGTRMGRRQLRYATTPSGHPWGRERDLPHRVWRHGGFLSPETRRAFFFMSHEGAYCPLTPLPSHAWGYPLPYLQWNRVRLVSESPPPSNDVRAKKRRAA